MTGPLQVLVDPSSAIQGRHWEDKDPFIVPINRIHSELVKFSKHDHDYQLVLVCLRGFLKEAREVIQRRFSTNVSGANTE